MTVKYTGIFITVSKSMTVNHSAGNVSGKGALDSVARSEFKR